MRFIVDECTGPLVSRWLREKGHDVFDIYEQARGISDEEVLEIANREKRILITNDKDFGEKIYRERKVHSGVILLRLKNERARNKIAVLEQLLSNYKAVLKGRFVVADEKRVRIS
ncbi:MAG: hypothetical protein D6770_10780 [Anaerolineae bacterium]|nr:MAG: hypothetical protein D6770_10780 [Anaerolineae bacterium]